MSRSRKRAARWCGAGSSSCRAGSRTLPDRVVERFAFTHSIYQQVFHQRVPPARRARLHLRIGERGESLYGRAVGEIAGELAVHFEQARDLPRAVKYRGCRPGTPRGARRTRKPLRA